MNLQCFQTPQGPAYVVDCALDEETLLRIDQFRESLPLDNKRPTVQRRFFADGSQNDNPNPPTAHLPLDGNAVDRPLAALLEKALVASIPQSQGDNTSAPFHVFRYQRFLEYTKEGSKLDAHTDGTKVCDDTGFISTHTLLLYLSTCEHGGETVLLERSTNTVPTSNGVASPGTTGSKNSASEERTIYATQPRRGRILLFPHATLHAGAVVQSVPKICLRAEVCVHGFTNNSA